MNKAIDNLQSALKQGMAGRPRVGGFPYLAETLRRAGVTYNSWYLPSCQSFYRMEEGSVVMTRPSLISDIAEVPPFDQAALITALRTNQAGESTFDEFLEASWKAGVVRYEVDFAARTVSYYGARNEVYVEVYPLAEI